MKCWPNTANVRMSVCGKKSHLSKDLKTKNDGPPNDHHHSKDPNIFTIVWVCMCVRIWRHRSRIHFVALILTLYMYKYYHQRYSALIFHWIYYLVDSYMRLDMKNILICVKLEYNSLLRIWYSPSHSTYYRLHINIAIPLS